MARWFICLCAATFYRPNTIGFGRWPTDAYGSARSEKITTSFNSKLNNASSISLNGSKLYFGVDLPEENKLSYSLPPKPPTGSFDVRFAGDWKVAHEIGTIDIMNSSELIHIQYNHIQ